MNKALTIFLLALMSGCRFSPPGVCGGDSDCRSDQACVDGVCVARPAVATLAPTIAARLPQPGATGVAVATVVKATFSEPLDPATVGTASFTLFAGASRIEASVTCVGATATLTPAAPLAYSTSFTATLTSGVKDLAGNALAAEVVWSFTTAAAPNAAPDATPVTTVAGIEDLAAGVTLTGIDAEDLEAHLAVEVVTAPSHGTLSPSSGAAPLLVTYMPAADWSGLDAFAFRVIDTAGAASAPFTVRLEVAPVNDPPVASPLAVSATEDAAISIVLTGADVESPPAALGVAIASAPAHGTLTPSSGSAPLTVSYRPAADWSGDDAFTYRVTDPDGGVATASVAITVAAVNDPPFASSTTTSTVADTPIALTLTGTDVDDPVPSLTVTVTSAPAHGSVSPTSGAAPLSVTYTPAVGWSGVDAFSYRVDDPHGARSAPATFTVNVQAVAHPPVAVADAATVCLGATALIPVLANDTDADGDPLSLASVSVPGHGTAVISGSSVSYAPAPGYSGPDAFTYGVSDGTGRSAIAAVTITVSEPTIDALFPTTGTTGLPLQISGRCFGEAEGTVSIGGRPATVTTWTPRYVVATVPTDGQPGDHAVVLAPPSAAAASSTYRLVPWIGDVEPWYAASGEAQSLLGDGFVTPAGTVRYGSIPAPVAGWTNTLIQARVPVSATTWTLQAQTSTGLTTNTVPITSAGPDTWWTPRVPQGRLYHSAVWTGTEMIVWGGYGVDNVTLGDGGRYDPRYDTWVPTPAVNRSRAGQSAVWTGKLMIVWGKDSSGLATGNKYDPARHVWFDVTRTGAPMARQGHVAVWTGKWMLVWGGHSGSSYFNGGGRYDPTFDWWDSTPMMVSAPSPRSGHAAVWTGKEMIVWGGFNGTGYLATGGRYDPATDRWTPVAAAGAPSPRTGAVAVWTGKEMIVWGGNDGGASFLANGARYDPVTDAWTPLADAGAPSARTNHTAVWTGKEMVVWGGDGQAGALATGGRYDPAANTWAPTSVVGAPTARGRHTAIWTGDEMIVWGGLNALDSGGRYRPSTDSWVPTRSGSPGEPTRRRDHASACVGGDLVVWGGYSLGLGDVANGGRYHAATDTWVALATSGAPSAREGHTAVDTGTSVIVWGGKNVPASGPTTYLADGARWDPAADEWTAISTSGAPSARAGHTAVWAGGKMVVFGGRDASAVLQTGGAYDPGTDTWEALPTVNAPTARQRHTAVSTGDAMIVWGGASLTGSSYDGTGAQYDVAARTWTPLPAGPTARSGHSAVWTGSKMIVWGGYDGTTVADGSAFTPGTGWSAIASNSVGRSNHAAVWDGARMLVWGGAVWGSNRAELYRYDAASNVWSGTWASGAPIGRQSPSACWTGSRLVVWGGSATGSVAGLGAYWP